MAAQQKQGMGCFAKGCITLLIIGLVIAGIAGVGGYMAYNYAKSFIATAPAQIPVKTVTPEQYAEIKNRFESFRQAVKNNVESRLELTADDINARIAMEDEWKDLRGKCQFRIENGQIFAQASIPLEKLDPKNSMFAGKYLNGTIGIEVSINDGEVMLYPRTIEVNGKRAPDAMMKAFSGPDYEKSFKEGFHRDMKPETAAILAKIKSFKIENNKIIIQSAGAPASGSPAENTAAPNPASPGEGTNTNAPAAM